MTFLEHDSSAEALSSLIMTPVEQAKDLQTRRDHMLHLLSSWSDDQLRQQPKEGGWCALEVLVHIITSERGTLGYMLKKTSSGTEGLEDAGEGNQMASQQLNDALKSPGRWLAPAVLPPPNSSLDIEGLATTWIKTQSSMLKFVEDLPPEAANKLVFKHPIAGRFNLEQTLSFLSYHIEHHLHQLERIRNSISA